MVLMVENKSDTSKGNGPPYFCRYMSNRSCSEARLELALVAGLRGNVRQRAAGSNGVCLFAIKV